MRPARLILHRVIPAFVGNNRFFVFGWCFLLPLCVMDEKFNRFSFSRDHALNDLVLWRERATHNSVRVNETGSDRFELYSHKNDKNTKNIFLAKRDDVV
jgi:hypothetical protein